MYSLLDFPSRLGVYLREFILLRDLWCVELGQEGHEKASVLVVRHTSTIVTFPGQVDQGIVRGVIVVIQEHLQGR